MMDESVLVLQAQGLTTKEEVLTYLGQQLVDKGIAKESFLQAILDREKVFATGLQFEGYGVALPHTDAEHVNKTQLAVLTLQEPVTFIQMATTDQAVSVSLIIMLAIKEAHSQVEMLQKLMTFLQDKETVEQLLSLGKGQESLVFDSLKANHII